MAANKVYSPRVEDKTDHTHNASDNYYKTYRCEYCGGKAYTQWNGTGNVIRVSHSPSCTLWVYLVTSHPRMFYDWG